MPAETFGAMVARVRTRTTRPGTTQHANGPLRWRLPVSLSQNELARRALVNPAYVNRIEKGDRGPPRRSIVERLADALELDDHDRARLLVAAGYWPWPDLDAERAALVLATALAVVDGDYRRLGMTDIAESAPSCYDGQQSG